MIFFVVSTYRTVIYIYLDFGNDTTIWGKMSKALGESFSQSASGTASPSKYTNVPPSTTTSKRNRRSMLGSDEFMAAAIGDTAWLRQSLKAGKNPANFDKM